MVRNRIKIVLVEKGITQRALAQLIGLKECSISKWNRENGTKHHPTLNQLGRIANALDVDVRELIQGIKT